MALLNYGSFCVDNVYTVEHFVQPGETLPSIRYEIHPGGKGLNQSLALARAGASVRHAGKVGPDGIWLKDLLSDAGVDTAATTQTETANGHAIIQVTPAGENAIVLYGGANREITTQDFEAAFADSAPGDFLLLQNEISHMPELINYAAERQQRIVFNVAPYTAAVQDYPLEKIEYFILNEIEASGISGVADTADIDGILEALRGKLPDARFVLTLGKAGVVYQDASETCRQASFQVEAVDTTGAGDTFTGYFLAGLIEGLTIAQCLDQGCRAAALCVTRAGAATSIPSMDEVKTFNPTA